MSHPAFACTLTPHYLPEESSPSERRFVFAYTVKVHNVGDVTAQLVARHWVITDGLGQVHEVKGLAVVGHQPVLRPGEQFEYSSWTPLETPAGLMRGVFHCITEDLQWFEAEVAETALQSRASLH